MSDKPSDVRATLSQIRNTVAVHLGINPNNVFVSIKTDPVNLERIKEENPSQVSADGAEVSAADGDSEIVVYDTDLQFEPETDEENVEN